MSQVIIAVIVTGVIVAAITWVVANQHRQKTYEAKIGSAEERSREIIDEALKIAETKKREALLEAKEESLKTKNELEKETKERRAELQRYERRVLSKEENLDKKAEAMEKREAGMNVKEEALKRKTAEAEALYEKGMLELEKISGLTSEQAKEYLLRSVEEDVKHDTARLIKDLEAKAKEEAEKKAKDYVVTAIQRCAADHVAETTVSVVQLPNDEMKGRIIGREGRNTGDSDGRGTDHRRYAGGSCPVWLRSNPERGSAYCTGTSDCGWTDSSGQNRRDGREGTERSGKHDARGGRSSSSGSWHSWYPSGTCQAAW
mgnify:CR=1 FL=1